MWFKLSHYVTDSNRLVTSYLPEIEGTHWACEGRFCRHLLGWLRIFIWADSGIDAKCFKLLNLCIQNFFPGKIRHIFIQVCTQLWHTKMQVKWLVLHGFSNFNIPLSAEMRYQKAPSHFFSFIYIY